VVCALGAYLGLRRATRHFAAVDPIPEARAKSRLVE
jgi:hypothetical protein